MDLSVELVSSEKFSTSTIQYDQYLPLKSRFRRCFIRCNDSIAIFILFQISSRTSDNQLAFMYLKQIDSNSRLQCLDFNHLCDRLRSLSYYSRTSKTILPSTYSSIDFFHLDFFRFIRGNLFDFHASAHLLHLLGKIDQLSSFFFPTNPVIAYVQSVFFV